MIADSQRSSAFSVIVTTYQRPRNLTCVLASLADQAAKYGPFEIVVSDDGSADDTPQVVENFRAQSDLSVLFVTHDHDGFQAAKCRNQGALAASGDYLIFLDGDCVAGENFVNVFSAQRRSGEVLAGDVYYLTEDQTDSYFARPGLETLATLEPTDEEVHRVRRRHRKFQRAEFYGRFWRPKNLIKPALKSGVFGIWRSDFYRVNGFDQNYVGWGCEDDDLGMRLRMAGIKIHSVIPEVDAFHLWHPRGETVPDKWKDGANADYFQRRGRLTRCANGIQRRVAGDLQLTIRGNPNIHPTLGSLSRRAGESSEGEVEVVIWPGGGAFSSRSDCRLLINTSPELPPKRLWRKADVVVSACDLPRAPFQSHFGLEQIDQALGCIS